MAQDISPHTFSPRFAGKRHRHGKVVYIKGAKNCMKSLHCDSQSASNEAIQALLNRRSVRAYQTRQVDGQALEQILMAGAYAPSAMGRQPAVMVVVQDKETIAKLSRLNAAVMHADNDPFYGAPTVIVVLSDTDKSVCPMQDGSLVMGNLMNAASALGVDSCWINRAKEVFDTDEGKALLRQWGLNGHYMGVGNCILGYGAGERPTAKPREAVIVRV